MSVLYTIQLSVNPSTNYKAAQETSKHQGYPLTY
jgi:hypothetical protein